MQPSLKRSRRALTALMVCGALFLAAPAIAQTVLGTFIANANGVFSGTVTIPESTPPGIYDLVATGVGPVTGPYPPTSTGSLSVSSNVVVAGQSITVSGGGFTPNSTVTVSLHFVASASDSTFTIAQTTTGPRVLTARIKVVAPGTDLDKDLGGGTTIINNDNRVSCVSNATATALMRAVRTLGPVVV